MSRININELSAQAGGLAYRTNLVRTDPAVVKAAKDAWSDVNTARNSCAVLARETNAAWQRSGTPEVRDGARAQDRVPSRSDEVNAPALERSVL